MNKCVSMFAVSLVAAAVYAQEAADGESNAEPSEEAAEASVGQAKQAQGKVFTSLPFCRTIEGVGEVRIPGSDAWVAAEEGRFYPLGSSYRVIGNGRMTIAFGPECIATIVDGAEFGTRVSTDGKSRTVVLGSGILELDLARNLPEGAFFVTAPGFVVKNPAGESKFVYTDKGDGEDVVVRCVTGTLAIDGQHFSIATMRAADEIRIRTSHDMLETILYGTSGDYIVKLDRGVVTKNEVADDGSVKPVCEESMLDWHLSPSTKVRINRLAPTVGKRLSVAVMTFDASGAMKNNFAFTEGRAEVNTGELVAAPKEEGEELAKRAAEATETTDVEDAEASDEANTENKKSEDTEE